MDNEGLSEPSPEVLIEAVRTFPSIWQVSSKSYKDARARENAWKKVSTNLGINVEWCQRKRRALRDKFVREVRKLKKSNLSGRGGPPTRSSWAYFVVRSFLDSSVRHRRTYTNFSTSAFEESQRFDDPDSGADESQRYEGEIASTQQTSVNLLEESTEVEDHIPENQPAPSALPSPTTSESNLSSVCSMSVGSTATKRATTDAGPSKKRKKSMDPVELAIIDGIQQANKTEKNHDSDEEGYFGKQIAANLRRFTSHQKAMAKMRIQQIMFDVEFGELHNNQENIH